MSIILWNKLDNQNSVIRSELGDNLVEELSPVYEPCKFGNGIKPTAGNYAYHPDYKRVLNNDAFTIELFVKYTYDVTNGIPSIGGFRTLFRAGEDGGGYVSVYLAHRTTGLQGVIVINGLFTLLGTGITVGSWSTGTIKHWAMVYDKNGIDGGVDTAQVYMDGVKVYGSGATSQFIMPTGYDGRFNIGWFRTAYPLESECPESNLKIYNHAKTTFSDSLNIHGFGGQKMRSN